MFTGHTSRIEMRQTKRVWVFPKHDWFEWEPKDEKSCRLLGIGHEEERETITVFPNVIIKSINMTPQVANMVAIPSTIFGEF